MQCEKDLADFAFEGRREPQAKGCGQNLEAGKWTLPESLLKESSPTSLFQLSDTILDL